MDPELAIGVSGGGAGGLARVPRSVSGAGAPGLAPMGCNTWVENSDPLIFPAFVDYLRVTVKGQKRPVWVIRELAHLLGVGADQFEDRDWGAHFYRAAVRGPLGVLVLYDHATVKDCLTFDLPGKALATVTPARVQAMLLRWSAAGVEWRVKRIDLAVDGLPASVGDVEKAWREDEGAIRCRAERDSFGSFSNAQGQTFAIGSRLSQRYMRVYNAHGPVRVELECKGNAALVVGALLMLTTSPEKWGAFIMGAFAEFIDFGTSWWKAFMGGAARLRLGVSCVAEVALADVRRWLMRQVAPSLGLLLIAGGGDAAELVSMAREGAGRLRGPRLALARAVA